MADAGSIYYQALSGMGDDFARSMQEYHRQHQAYDEAYGMADALSRIGIDKTTGQPVQIQYDEKGKPINGDNVQPIGDPKALEQYKNFNRRNAAANAGALNAISRLMASGLSRVQAAAIEKSMQDKVPVEVVPGTTLNLSEGQAANVLMTKEAAKSPPAGKQYWEGDTESPPGYYTPNQISRIRGSKQAQTAKGEYQQLRTDMSLAKEKLTSKAKELSEFSKAYGFPPELFDSTTKVYGPKSKIHGTPGMFGREPITVPEGQYAIDVMNPKTGDTTPVFIGMDEFNKGKNIYEDVKKHRDAIGQLGNKVQTEAASLKSKLDWANANPNHPQAAAVKAKAEAMLNQLSALGTQPEPTPAPVQEEE